MSTTTIRIEDDLKARVAAAAMQAGKTAHAFILDAIAQTVEQAELDNAFHAVADARWAQIRATGTGRHGDFTDDAGPDLAPLLVLSPLAVLNIGPFAVSCHAKSFKNSLRYWLDCTFRDFHGIQRT